MTIGQRFRSCNIYPVFKDARAIFDERVWASIPGPVAQLGERLVCIQEVVGSIPVGSTRALWSARLGPIAQSG